MHASFRQLNIKKVLVSGGSLDHRVVPQILNEGGGEKVAILALDEAGRVSAIWKCFYSVNKAPTDEKHYLNSVTIKLLLLPCQWENI